VQNNEPGAYTRNRRILMSLGLCAFIASFPQMAPAQLASRPAEDCIDEGFFPQIKRKADEAHVNNVETVLGKFTDPNLPSRNVDMVFFHDVLHHIQDRAGYLKSVAGYLKPGGRVVVIDYEAGQGPHKAQPELQVSREQLGAWAKEAGLKQAEEVKMFPDRYFLAYSR
jgi:ubiquinone/menaquinone biosynthesis C-methylase UbiE